jgi:hypothetical protein
MFFCNELSIESQFDNRLPDFESALREVLSIRRYLHQQNFELKCRWQLRDREAQQSVKFSTLLHQIDNELKRSILGWLSIDHELPLALVDDVSNIRIHGVPVEESVFADVVFQQYCDETGSVVSFAPSIRFTNQILPVSADVVGTQRSYNIYNIQSLNDAKNRLPVARPRTWEGYIELWKAENQSLQFAPYLLDRMRPEPFERVTADAVERLLHILNDVQSNREAMRLARIEGNSLMEQKHKTCLDELYAKFFQGQNAKFTDESVTNKKDFKRALTFVNPSGGTDLFCSYHGKASHNVWRVHYSWPLGDGQPLCITYIGPKITRG